MDLKVHRQYITVSFRKNDKQLSYKLHRIIAELFVEKPENKSFVNHIDGNPSNSAEENLELICQNCHSLTLSYKNRNKGNGRRLR
jgi:5-methylcytosine-specific restriction endonuclease McrA